MEEITERIVPLTPESERADNECDSKEIPLQNTAEEDPSFRRISREDLFRCAAMETSKVIDHITEATMHLNDMMHAICGERAKEHAAASEDGIIKRFIEAFEDCKAIRKASEESEGFDSKRGLSDVILLLESALAKMDVEFEPLTACGGEVDHVTMNVCNGVPTDDTEKVGKVCIDLDSGIYRRNGRVVRKHGVIIHTGSRMEGEKGGEG